MQSFVEVIKLGSFSEAAKILGLSRALISRHITDLEKHLGVRLLTRTTRRITLTEAGTEHFNFCQRVIKEIEAARHFPQTVAKRAGRLAKNSCPQITYYIGAGGRDREFRGGLSSSSYQSHAR